MSTIPKSVADNFTREGALAVETAADAKRYVGQAAKFSRESGERESFVGVVAAYATHAAIRTGYLGGPDGKSQDEYADLFGRSKSAVTLWKRLGRAFVDLGIDPESDLGSVVRTGANVKAIADAIKAEDATEASVRKAAESVYQTGTDGALTTAKIKTARAPGEPGGQGNVEVPRNDDTRLTMMEACLAALGDENGNLTPGIAKRLGELADAIAQRMETGHVAKSA